MENQNERSFESRIYELEKALTDTLACLGLVLLSGPEGRVGYKLAQQGPKEGWGILPKILDQVNQQKEQKKIIIPGR